MSNKFIHNISNDDKQNTPIFTFLQFELTDKELIKGPNIFKPWNERPKL